MVTGNFVTIFVIYRVLLELITAYNDCKYIAHGYSARPVTERHQSRFSAAAFIVYIFSADAKEKIVGILQHV